MRNIQTTSHLSLYRRAVLHKRARAVAVTSEQQRMMRGVVNGLILSLAIWLAAGYLTVILR